MKIASALLLCVLLRPGRAAAAEIAWDESWPRFRASEYAVTGLALAGAGANYFFVSPPKSAVWRADILFDKEARSTLLIQSEAGRRQAGKDSDYLIYPLIAYALLDGPVTAGWVDGNKDAALQLSLINAETLAVVEVLNLTVANVLPRRRPEGAICNPASKYDPNCVKSFWSGHTANAFAAAGLVCAEHRALALYGGAADGVACATTLAAASAVGVLRISAGNHHASDVLMGAVVGGSIGYLMPNLLHFGFKKSGRRLGYLIPSVEPHGGGLTYVRPW